MLLVHKETFHAYYWYSTVSFCVRLCCLGSTVYFTESVDSKRNDNWKISTHSLDVLSKEKECLDIPESKLQLSLVLSPMERGNQERVENWVLSHDRTNREDWAKLNSLEELQQMNGWRRTFSLSENNCSVLFSWHKIVVFFFFFPHTNFKFPLF